MNCQEAREVLAHDFPSAAHEQQLQAHSHIRSCGRCQSRLREDTELRNHLKGLVREKLSTEFKEKLFTEISKLRWQKAARERRIQFRLAAAAMIIAVLLAAGAVWYMHRSPSNLIDYLVEDHQENLPGRFMMTSSSPADIERWFDGKLDFPVHVHSVHGAELVGARLCRVENTRAALVFYRCHSRLISWFIFHQKVPPSHSDTAPQTSSARGYSVIQWNEKGLTHAVVSDLESGELLEMLSLK
ncbi:MAG TPA: hypothetical protein VGQ81_12655 [Acidobacteriota bacterium]|jgi:anti-sigma factor RsiW|nr:hypothetical protein [Acidobacteriota bacterium]